MKGAKSFLFSILVSIVFLNLNGFAEGCFPNSVREGKNVNPRFSTPESIQYEQSTTEPDTFDSQSNEQPPSLEDTEFQGRVEGAGGYVSLQKCKTNLVTGKRLCSSVNVQGEKENEVVEVEVLRPDATSRNRPIETIASDLQKQVDAIQNDLNNVFNKINF